MAQHDLFGKGLLHVMQRESDHVTVLHRLVLKQNQIGAQQHGLLTEIPTMDGAELAFC
jgi:hypothetical protein